MKAVTLVPHQTGRWLCSLLRFLTRSFCRKWRARQPGTPCLTKLVALWVCVVDAAGADEWHEKLVLNSRFPAPPQIISFNSLGQGDIQDFACKSSRVIVVHNSPTTGKTTPTSSSSEGILDGMEVPQYRGSAHPRS